MRKLAAVIVCLALPVMRATAQGTDAEEPGPRVSPAFGIHYGQPLRLSLAVGMLVDRSTHGNDGLIVMAEPGRMGTAVSAGYFHMFQRFGSGYSLRGVALRTTREPWNASAHTTYVGVEADWMLLFGVGGRIGYLRRASHSVNDPHDNVVTLGVGIGH